LTTNRLLFAALLLRVMRVILETPVPRAYLPFANAVAALLALPGLCLSNPCGALRR
jgi:hypothetical protein